MEDMTTPQKIWKCGNSLAISIPKKIAEIKGYEKGKLAQITWGDVIGKDGENSPRKPKAESCDEVLTKEEDESGEESNDSIGEDSEDSPSEDEEYSENKLPEI